MPASGLQVVVEPAEQNLVGRQAEELIQSLILQQQAVQFGVNLDVNLGQKTTTNDLPDETQDEVLTALLNVARANVDNGTSDTLGRGNNNVVVLRHLERVQLLLLRSRLVQDTLVDRLGHRVVDQLGKDQTV